MGKKTGKFSLGGLGGTESAKKANDPLFKIELNTKKKAGLP